MSKFINNNSTNNNVENGPHSEYSDHIYVEESRGKEQLYDRNNPLVRIILLVLGAVAFFGTLYYILMALGTIK